MQSALSSLNWNAANVRSSRFLNGVLHYIALDSTVLVLSLCSNDLICDENLVRYLNPNLA